MRSVRTALLITAISISVLGAAPAYADGMQPATSVVIIYEEDGEATMNVKNTDSRAGLLHTTIEHIPEDEGTIVVATPPVARVEAGEQQMVRFIYQGPALTTQRMKRVSFEGVGQRQTIEGHATVGVGVRHNIPLLLHPKGLARHRSPWELLQWSLRNNQLTVRNDSAYVVRMEPQISLMPSGAKVNLERTYLLPGQSFVIPVADAGQDTTVVLHPASVYGYSVDAYEASLK